MTSLGKLLVYLNTFLAVILFGWAVSLYSNRVDWFDRTLADGTKIDGQIPMLQAEIKRYSDQIKATQQAYAAAVDRLDKTELQRDFRNAVLAKRMREIKTVDAQAKFLEQIRDGRTALIDVRNEGATVKGLGGTDLQGLASLSKRYSDLTTQRLAHQKAIDKLRTEYDALSDEILQVQAEVLRQKLIFDNLKDEQDYLSDARINWEEQLRTLEIRKSQLLSRLEALGVSPKVSQAISSIKR